ncbi:MAG: sodium:proton antiporter NhaD [Bacteroidota bacterium]
MEAILAIVFIVGYLAIALEHPLNINKAAPAILTGVLCWTVYVVFSSDAEIVNHQLAEHLAEISGILFFLLGAMTIVELIDSHNGFETITSRITTNDKRKLLWIISIITFFLSSVLDNLTTAIVMTSLARKLVSNRNERLLIVGMIVIAANAGGAWSPIGDVTTTMLWIGGQITPANIIIRLIIPSLICLIVPLFMVTHKFKGLETVRESISEENQPVNKKERTLIFVLGISSLIMVPVFKTVTHLPPYLGILLGLGLMWVVTELMHKNKQSHFKGQLSVTRALEKIDTSSILFFLGILVAVSSLQSTGMLKHVAAWLDQSIGDLNAIVVILGLLSSVIDNVPLVAAAMGMYDITVYPTDHFLWEFLAYCCGTGGSCLIIGSAAGVAAMGMEKIEFFWYVRNVTFYALAGYLAGAVIYIAMEPLFMH